MNDENGDDSRNRDKYGYDRGDFDYHIHFNKANIKKSNSSSGKLNVIKDRMTTVSPPAKLVRMLSKAHTHSNHIVDEKTEFSRFWLEYAKRRDRSLFSDKRKKHRASFSKILGLKSPRLKMVNLDNADNKNNE